MDNSKLKKRPPFPMETIAVAVGFSPRLDAVIAEAARIKNFLNANIILIHVGEKTSDKEDALEKSMNKVGLDSKTYRVIWMEGEPVDTILKLCKLNIVDLLILGALEKENIFKFYLGSVARSISRKAKTSVLLITQPKVESNKAKKVVVSGIDNPKTIHTINTALYFAQSIGSKDVSIVTELHNPALAMTMADSSTAPEVTKIKKEFTEEQTNKYHTVIEECQKKFPDMRIKEKVVKGKPGYAISKYAREKDADLLVINSPDVHLNVLDRIFTHDIEFILADLPTNLLIVHSRL